MEGAGLGILANSISPSWVDTPMMAASLGSLAKTYSKSIGSMYEEAKNSNPQKPIIAPREIAQQIVWLALDAPFAITGEDIFMTGDRRCSGKVFKKFVLFLLSKVCVRNLY